MPMAARSETGSRAGNLAILLDPVPGGVFWDCGCGTGVLALRLAQSGATVIATDSEFENTRQAESTLRMVGTGASVSVMHLADPTTAPVEVASLDGVALRGSAPGGSSAPSDDLLAFLRERLRPGGRLLVGFDHPARRREAGVYHMRVDTMAGRLRRIGFGAVERYAVFPSLSEPERVASLDHREALLTATETSHARVLRSIAGVGKVVPAFWRLVRFTVPAYGLVGIR